MKTINHLFFGSSWLLVSQMITKIITYSKHSHHFVIVINEDGIRTKYEELFKSLSYSDYEYWDFLFEDHFTFLQSCKLRYLYAQLLMSGVLVRYFTIYRWLFIYSQIRKTKLSNLIIHSELNEIALLFWKKRIRIAWCCWGDIPKKTVVLSMKSILRREYHYRSFLDKCEIIITLTDDDKRAFEDFYGYDKIILSSYSYIYNFELLKFFSNNTNRILIGNSAFYLKDYLDLAIKLGSIRGMHFTFMCSYGIDVNSDKFFKWKTDVERLLTPNNEVEFWTENIPLEEYNNKIATYQAYVAPMKRQSGLGAATTAIGIGLKCFLNGVNYDYFTNKGLVVYPLSDLFEYEGIGIIYLDESIRNSNSIKIREVCGVNQSVDDWEKIYASFL